jgi:vancomycin permeability regulator SanA
VWCCSPENDASDGRSNDQHHHGDHVLTPVMPPVSVRLYGSTTSYGPDGASNSSDGPFNGHVVVLRHQNDRFGLGVFVEIVNVVGIEFGIAGETDVDHSSIGGFELRGHGSDPSSLGHGLVRARVFAMIRVRVARLFAGAIWLVTGLLAIPWLGFWLSTSSAISTVDGAPQTKVALVLGAGLTVKGTPSNALARRVETGVALYKHGRVKKLLMSGDNSRATYDEVSAMKKLAVSLGVPKNDVLLDYAGFRTLDSCIRVRKVFGQTRIIVVSQRFHLARAIHLCRSAGVTAFGVSAPDIRGFSSRLVSAVRELPASTQAWFDAHILHTEAAFLGPSIDIDNPTPEALEQPLSSKRGSS